MEEFWISRSDLVAQSWEQLCWSSVVFGTKYNVKEAVMIWPFFDGCQDLRVAFLSLYRKYSHSRNDTDSSSCLPGLLIDRGVRSLDNGSRIASLGK